MPRTRIGENKLDETIAFHGHWCPGLAIGVRAAGWAIPEMGKSSAEGIVAVVETDVCSVDARVLCIPCFDSIERR
jgi:formylmethanofuran dehydrogenase subunit E